jgi:hypothetical protein
VRRLDGFLYEAAKDLEIFPKIQDQKLKSKTYRG